MNLLELALGYHSIGYNVIPVNTNKKPYFKWQKYQTEKVTVEEIKQWWTEYPTANIGIVTGMISGIAVIDIDSDKGKDAIQEYIPDSCIMPVAKTPSGGLHYYFKCPDDKLTNNARLIEDCDLRANGGYIVAPPSQNGNGKHYQWLQGLSIFDVDLPEMPLKYLQFIYNNNNSFSLCMRVTQNDESRNVTEVTNSNKILIKGRRDNDIFHIANCMLKGGMDANYAYQVLNLIAKKCEPPFSEEEVKIKIQSALNRQERKFNSVAYEAKEWIESQTGHWKVTNGHSELHLVTKEDKNAFKQVVYRMKKEGIIEPTGTMAGVYRKVDKSFAPLSDFSKDVLAPIDIRLPFKLDNYAKIFQSNIIVFAGEKSTGKTALCLNFTELNFDSPYPMRYISSEFSGGELYERLLPMKTKPEQWIKRVEFNRFRGEPHDAVNPDGINIIDYLEVRESKFYEIGNQIDKIYDKLEKGIAIVCLQMNRGQEIARGGSMTLDKSRLYVALNRKRTDNGLKNYATIIDCKNRRHPEINPNDFYSEYKLVGGYNFKQVTEWMPK